MVYVTHDQVEAMTLADRIVVLNAGRIEQVGAPLELYNRPANRFVAGFIGSPTMNFIEGEEAAKANAASIGIRPEHLLLAKDGPWQGTVLHAEHLGADTMLYLESARLGLLTVRIGGDIPVNVGESVSVSPLAGKLHRFDADGKRIGA